MLFIVFDIEIVFPIHGCVPFDKLGVFALVEMPIFMAAVFVAARMSGAGGFGGD